MRAIPLSDENIIYRKVRKVRSMSVVEFKFQHKIGVYVSERHVTASPSFLITQQGHLFSNHNTVEAIKNATLFPICCKEFLLTIWLSGYLIFWRGLPCLGSNGFYFFS